MTVARTAALALTVALLRCAACAPLPEPLVASAAPESIAPLRWGEYFEAVRSYARSELDLDVELGTRPDIAEAMANGVRLAVLARENEGLSVQMTPWMIKTVDFMRRVYDRGGCDGTTRAKAPWSRMEQDMGLWLRDRLPKLTTNEQREVARTVFEVDERFESHTPYSARWPGFDTFEWGLRLMDASAADESFRDPPVQKRTCRPGRSCEEEAPCRDYSSFQPDPRGDLLRRHIACEWLYESVADGVLSPRLASVMIKRDPAWTATVVRMLTDQRRGMRDPPLPVVSLWRALEGNVSVWSAATRAFVEAGRTCTDLHALAAAAGPPWVAYPDRRGTLLYLILRDLVSCGPGFPEPRAMRAHLALLGDLPGETLVGSMLDASYLAVPLAIDAWPAMREGFTPSKVILDHMDPYLDRKPTDARDTLVKLVRRQCEAHDERGLARLHAYLERRTAAHVDEDVHFGDLVASTRTRCVDLRRD